MLGLSGRVRVLVDNEAHVWNAYGVQPWPTEVLIDKQGRIRAEFAGELNREGSGEYKTVGRRIEALRAEGVGPAEEPYGRRGFFEFKSHQAL